MNSLDNKIKLALFILLIGAFSVAVYSPKYNNTITGKDIFTRVEITDVVPIDCTFNLNTGWNYVSFHCISSSVSRDEVLSSINSSYESVFAYNAFDATDPWKSYNPDLPSWAVQQLNYMGRTTGYIILMNTNTTYNHSGYKRPSTVQLTSGWNLVGYPSAVNKSINDSLNGLLYTRVMTYKNGNLYIYTPNSTNNSLTNFEPNYAYWINSSASQNWLMS